MLAFIGFLVVCFLALGATAMTFITLAMGGDSLGPTRGWQLLRPLGVFCVAAGLWYLAYSESPFNVTFTG